jgi:hypothetical protein
MKCLQRKGPHKFLEKEFQPLSLTEDLTWWRWEVNRQAYMVLGQWKSRLKARRSFKSQPKRAFNSQTRKASSENLTVELLNQLQQALQQWFTSRVFNLNQLYKGNEGSTTRAKSSRTPQSILSCRQDKTQSNCCPIQINRLKKGTILSYSKGLCRPKRGSNDNLLRRFLEKLCTRVNKELRVKCQQQVWPRALIPL